MIDQQFPPGWDLERIQRLIEHYEQQSDEALAAEDDEAALETSGQTMITVPDNLLPAIRQLLASHKSA